MTMGYLSRDYARSLRGVGDALELADSGGWLLRRAIGGSALHDAMGIYPFMVCRDWNSVAHDLERLSEELVSVVFVTDPFADLSTSAIADYCTTFAHFKDHYVVDLTTSAPYSPATHHRRRIRKGVQQVQVEVCEDASAHGASWVRLYSELIERHAIAGIARFPDQSLLEQLRVPGAVLFRGISAGEDVGMTLWFQHREVAYYHLGAYTSEGYEVGASYAIFSLAIEYFRGRVALLGLGAGAGIAGGRSDGLTRFKAGWANATRPVYLAGKVVNQGAYDALVRARGSADGSYFPLYRAGEY